MEGGGRPRRRTLHDRFDTCVAHVCFGPEAEIELVRLVPRAEISDAQPLYPSTRFTAGGAHVCRPSLSFFRRVEGYLKGLTATPISQMGSQVGPALF